MNKNKTIFLLIVLLIVYAKWDCIKQKLSIWNIIKPPVVVPVPNKPILPHPFRPEPQPEPQPEPKPPGEQPQPLPDVPTPEVAPEPQPRTGHWENRRTGLFRYSRVWVQD